MKQGAAETPAHRRITQINVTPEVPRDVSGALRICNAGPGRERGRRATCPRESDDVVLIREEAGVIGAGQLGRGESL